MADNLSNTELAQYRSFQSIFSRKGRRQGNPAQGNWMARNQTSNTVLPSTFQFASHTRHGSRACGSRVDGCRIASVGLKFRRSQFLSRNSGNMWQFRRVSVRKMIPFSEKGIVKQFHCSKCDWTLDLECPFFYSDHARRAEESRNAEHWYSAHDCSRFQKPAKRSGKS